MAEELHEGDQAPDITLPTQTGEEFKLSDLKGKRVVLFFYPKADTPGCTKEACSFRDHSTTFTNSNAVLVGISPLMGRLHFEHILGRESTLARRIEAREAWQRVGRSSCPSSTCSATRRFSSSSRKGLSSRCGSSHLTALRSPIIAVVVVAAVDSAINRSRYTNVRRMRWRATIASTASCSAGPRRWGRSWTHRAR